MDEDQTPIEPIDCEQIVERRSIDPALLGGIIAGAGAALGPPLGALTDHWLAGQEGDQESPVEIELPPGVDTD